MVIVSVINIKGGVGKTTTAIALATLASRAGRDVTVLDADPQGSATAWCFDAEEDGDALPFEVRSANVADIRRLAKRRSGDSLVIVDTPPSGPVTDEALVASDFVVIPVSPSATEVQKTWETIGVVEGNSQAYAVLINRVDRRTLSYAELKSALDENGVSYFENVIPMREALRKTFGHAFGDETFGYDGVYGELEEAIG